MQINTFTFANQSFPNVAPTSYLWGNIGDVITCVIEFTRNAPSFLGLEFIFNLIPTSYNVSTSEQQLQNNLHSEAAARYKGTVTQSTGVDVDVFAQVPKSGDISTDGKVIYRKLSGNSFRLTYSFVLTPMITANDDNSNSLNTPAYFNGSACLRPYFKILLYANNIDPVPTHQQDTFALTAPPAGNTGFVGEIWNGGAPAYRLETFAFQGNLPALNPVVAQVCLLELKRISGNFTTAHKVRIMIMRVKDIGVGFEASETYLQNIDYEAVTIALNGTPVSGTKLVNVFGSVGSPDATLANIQFTIAANSYTERYVIIAKVIRDDTVSAINNAISNNVYVRLDTPAVQSTGNVALIPYPSALLPLVFLYHWGNDPATFAFNHVKAFVGDWFQALTQIAPAAGTTITSVSAQIKRRISGQILDAGFSVAPQNLPFNVERPYNLLTGDYRQQVQFVQSGSNILVKFAFYLQEGWIGFSDVVCSIIVQGENNGVGFVSEFQSPDFIMQDYELTLNELSEPRALGFTGSKQFALASNLSILADFVLAGFDTYTRATFRDDNLNNLQVTSPTDLAAYITIRPDGTPDITRQSIHSEWDISPSSPFNEVSGHTAGRTRISIASIKEAFIDAIVSWQKLQALYAGLARFIVTWRLDRKQPATFQFIELSFDFVAPDLNFLTWQLTEAVTNAQIVEIFSELPFSSLMFKVGNSNTGWAARPTLSFADFQTAVAQLNVGDWIYIQTNAANFTRAGIILKWVKGSNPTNPSNIVYTIPTNHTDVVDFIWFEKASASDNVVILSSTGSNMNTTIHGGTTTFLNLRTAPVTGGQYLDGWVTGAGGITAVNAAIAALPVGTKYGIGIAAFPSNASAASNTITFSANMDVTVERKKRFAMVSPHTNKNYRIAWNGNARNYDGIYPVTYDRCTAYTQLEYTQPVTYMMCFWTDLSKSGYIWSTDNYAEPNDHGVAGLKSRGIRFLITASQIELAYQHYNNRNGDFQSLNVRADGLKYGFNNILITHDGTGTAAGTKFYMNGVLRPNIVVTNNLLARTIVNIYNQFQFAEIFNNIGDNTWKGRLRIFQIAKRVLTGKELTQAYNKGSMRGIVSPTDMHLDVEFNQTGTNPPVDVSPNLFPITSSGAISYPVYYI